MATASNYNYRMNTVNLQSLHDIIPPADADPLYLSVDLRVGAGRICPVDTNLYPAGFNNLSREDAANVPGAFLLALRRRGIEPGANVGILSECHTRNLFYAENLFNLLSFLRDAGYRAEIACPDFIESSTVPTTGGQTITVRAIHNSGGVITFDNGFKPEFLLVNNDFSSGVPQDLETVVQPCLPSPAWGWHRRRKHRFFERYSELAGKLAGAAGIDPWLIVPAWRHVGEVDFKIRQGLDRIAAAADEILVSTRGEYARRGIDREPVAVVKSDHGTYGMSLMAVTSPGEILNMNRKTVNKMHIGKGKSTTTDILVMEGIPTDLYVDDCPAEPVIYLIDGLPVGAFWRHSCEKHEWNLNVAGMRFTPIDMRRIVAPELIHEQQMADILAVARIAYQATHDEVVLM